MKRALDAGVAGRGNAQGVQNRDGATAKDTALDRKLPRDPSSSEGSGARREEHRRSPGHIPRGLFC